MQERSTSFAWDLVVLLAGLSMVNSCREDRRGDAGQARDQRRLEEVQRLNGEARATFSKAEQSGTRADFVAAQRAADRVAGALSVVEAADRAKGG